MAADSSTISLKAFILLLYFSAITEIAHEDQNMNFSAENVSGMAEAQYLLWRKSARNCAP